MTRCKYPEDSVLCASECLTVGQQLRCARLKVGLTIEQVAKAVGVGKRTVMNYENDVVWRKKEWVVERIRDVVRNKS